MKSDLALLEYGLASSNEERTRRWQTHGDDEALVVHLVPVEDGPIAVRRDQALNHAEAHLRLATVFEHSVQVCCIVSLLTEDRFAMTLTLPEATPWHLAWPDVSDLQSLYVLLLRLVHTDWSDCRCTRSVTQWRWRF